MQSSAWFQLARHYDYCGERMNAAAAYFRSLIICPSTRAKEKIYLIMRQFFLTKWMLDVLNTFRKPAGGSA